jgi:hypothetical protein
VAIVVVDVAGRRQSSSSMKWRGSGRRRGDVVEVVVEGV